VILLVFQTEVLLLDAFSGKPLADPLKHDTEIVEIALNQSGLAGDRRVTFVDRNRDLYIAQVHRPGNFKLSTV
jgi:hypothetical protein